MGLLAVSALIARTNTRIGDRQRANLAPVLSAAAVIDRDAAGHSCQVVARHTQQLEWYSGCEASLELPTQRYDRVYVVRVAIMQVKLGPEAEKLALTAPKPKPKFKPPAAA